MVRKIPFENEYQLHKLTEKHMSELFDLKLIASEIQKDDYRFDSLAFDEKTSSFVIIEYKNKKDPTVINQAENYYYILLKNRDFFLDRLDFKDADFENTKVMIIAPEFESINDEFEFIKVSLYNNGKVTYTNMNTGNINELEIDLKDLALAENDLLKNKSKEVCDLYLNIKDRIAEAFDDINLHILVDAVSFRLNGKMILKASVKNTIKLYFYDNVTDTENQLRDISGIKTEGNAKWELEITSENIDYMIILFKEAYNINKVKNEKFIQYKNKKFEIYKTVKGKKTYFGGYDTLNEAVSQRDLLISENWGFDGEDVTLRKEGKYGRYIAFHNGSFRVHKQIDGKQRFIGAFKTKEEACKLRDMLIENNWDTSSIAPKYLRSTVTNPDVERLNNIRKVKDKFVVSKVIDGKLQYFGTYDTKEEAINAREKLLITNWKIEDEIEEEKIDTYVYLIDDTYIVRNDSGEVFGKFQDMGEAIRFRNECVRKNWKVD